MGNCAAKKGPGLTPDQEKSVQIVQTMFGMWGEGKFKTDLPEAEWTANMEAVLTKDCVWDFTGPNIAKYKKYDGVAAFKEWMAFLEKWDFPSMAPQFIAGPSGSNLAFMYMQYDAKFGESEMKGNTDVFVFNISGGKIKSCKQYWGKIGEINEKMGKELQEDAYQAGDQKANMGVIMTMFGNWGAGKYKTDLPADEWKTNVLQVWSPDVALDFRGPASKKYKKYSGVDDAKIWMTYLDACEFPNMAPTFFPGPPGSGKVYIRMQYDMKYKDAACSGLTDLMEWTVKDGKVVSMRQHFGDADVLNATYGEIWAAEDAE
ncbi:unnamed protein product [Amoebophrya sp. A25]|nr:unnamed protein product [Amoebophrya sp. A25]|eukprot:GSA25T00000532001.1